MNLHDLFTLPRLRTPEKPALRFRDGDLETVLSYADLFARADALAAELSRRGVRLGDRVALFLGNRPEFVVAYLAVIRLGGWTDVAERINPFGGAIALGHPLGMSGARIIGTTITALERKKATYGLATMCVGGGQGAATILKRVGA